MKSAKPTSEVSQIIKFKYPVKEKYLNCVHSSVPVSWYTVLWRLIMPCTHCGAYVCQISIIKNLNIYTYIKFQAFVQPTKTPFCFLPLWVIGTDNESNECLIPFAVISYLCSPVKHRAGPNAIICISPLNTEWRGREGFLDTVSNFLSLFHLVRCCIWQQEPSPIWSLW